MVLADAEIVLGSCRMWTAALALCAGSHALVGMVLSLLIVSTSGALVESVGREEAASRMLLCLDGCRDLVASHVVCCRGTDCAYVTGGA